MGTTAYVLGHAPDELRRLDAQSAFLRPATAALLASCGLAPGMRVLDVGCGSGEVTMMCADLVGPGGAVLGVDRAPEALDKARDRAELRGAAHARFREADLGSLTAAEPWDAVVGRMVLMHQPDPVAALSGLAALARPGGTIAFAEIVVMPATPAAPERPLMTRTCEWIARTLELAGASPRMGLGLHDAFVRAGLPAPEVRLEPLLTLGCEARLRPLGRRDAALAAGPGRAARGLHLRRGRHRDPRRAPRRGGGGGRRGRHALHARDRLGPATGLTGPPPRPAPAAARAG